MSMKLNPYVSNLRSRILTSAVILGALHLSTPAFAVDSASRNAARQLGYEGVTAYQKGDYKVAHERLERAYEVLKAPSLGLWSARALEKVGMLVEASERYLEATRAEVAAGGKEDVQRQAQKDAEAEREALLPRIPSITIQIEGADAATVDVSIGGSEISSALFGVPRATNPGHVEVLGTRGEDVSKAEVDLAEGDQKTITLQFSPLTAAPPPTQVSTASPRDEVSAGNWQRPAGWIGIIAGGTSLVAGGVFAGVGASKYSALDCTDGICTGAGQESKVDSYNLMRTLSTTTFIIGGVLAATGVTLLLTAPSENSQAAMGAYVGLGNAGLKGTF